MGRFFKDGAAPSPAINRDRRRDRATDELIGLCKGLLADGHLQDVEAKFLVDWLQSHAEFSSEYPFSALIDRVEHALANGVVDIDEERDLIDAMLKLSGNPSAAISPSAPAASSSLPLDRPPPVVAFAERTFVVTGVFHYGPRRLVMDEIEKRGGDVASSVSRKTNFLVVGTMGSEDWIHSSFGRKIERAVELKKTSATIAIVDENHWALALKEKEASDAAAED